MSEVVCMEDERTKRLEVYTESEFYGELRDRIAATTAGDRVVVMSMGFDPAEPRVEGIMDEMYSAAARQVDVQLGVDAYAFLIDGKQARLGPLFTKGHLEGKLSESFANRLDSLNRLDSYSSGHAAIINKPERPFTAPVAGRSHIKGAVVNDWWAEGGCNLMFTEKLDMMVGGEDAATADLLHGIMTQVVKAENVQDALGTEDLSYTLDPQTRLLIDVGRRNQSIILDTAHAFMRDADRWILLSCQFFPVGDTAKELSDALGRNVVAQTLFNHPSKHGLIDGAWQRASIAGAKLRLPDQLFGTMLDKSAPTTLHDKVLATNRGGAISTHNYIRAGVRLGTAELSIVRQGAKFGHSIGRTLLAQAKLLDSPQFRHITEP